jgi:UDPglucose 6-dehydrogenase
VTAEMIKYAANAYLATSISFINSLSQLAEVVGADITQVSQVLRLDRRIGRQAFLTVGPAWGGSCFPKDVRAITHFANDYGIKLPIVESALEVNNHQIQFVVNKIKSTLKTLKHKKIAIWGLAFKAKTDDVRESPSLVIIDELLKNGATIHAHDPIAEPNAKQIIPTIAYASKPEETAYNADAISILTDWPTFKEVDFNYVAKVMKSPILFDLRNMFDRQYIEGYGIRYFGLGR